MESRIQIIEKPDWVSWDEIHNVLWEAHSDNRDKGVVMRYPSLTGDEIRQRIEGKGKMLVAIDKEKVVGTAAIVRKAAKYWCGKGDYAYICFASVLPEYNGRGIYKALDLKREEIAHSMGLNRMLGDTHKNNTHRLVIAKKAGYRFVDYKLYGNHYNVVMVKWLDGCPYSSFWCSVNYQLRRMVVMIRSFRQALNIGSAISSKNH